MISTVWIFGLCVNLLLLMLILMRPRLWTTINTYTCFILILSCFYLSFLIIVNAEVRFSDDDILSVGLERLYDDWYRSIYCALKYIFSTIYLSLSLILIVVIIFIRSMMIKFASNIRIEKKHCKAHQAHLATVGLIGGIKITILFLGIVIGLAVHPQSPFDFPYVLQCRGVPNSNSEDQMERFNSNFKARLTYLIIMVFATISCHLRVIRFRQSYGNSYFRRIRRNISTFKDMMVSAYAMEVGAIAREVIIFILIKERKDFRSTIAIDNCMDILYCVLIPSYWLLSTLCGFKEFWSNESLFWRAQKRGNKPKSTNNTRSLEPRRPVDTDTPANIADGESFHSKGNCYPIITLPLTASLH